MSLIRSILILSLSIICLACSTPDPGPYHIIHAMKGSLPAYGNPIEVKVHRDHPVRVRFPEPIRVAHRKLGTQLLLDKKYDALLLQATEKFSDEGEEFKVRLWSGFQYKFVAKLADEDDQPQETRPGQVVFVEDTIAPVTPSSARASLKAPSEAQALLHRMIAADGDEIPGFEKAYNYAGHVVLNNKTLRGVVDTAYLSQDLKGFVVSLKNMTDRTVTLSPKMFRYKNILEIEFASKELAPRYSAFDEATTEGGYIDKVYIVTDAQGLARRAQG